MTNLLETYVACSITMAVITLLLFALSPWLGKRYKAKSLYAAWFVALLGFLVPVQIGIAQPRFTAEIPSGMAQPVFSQETKAVLQPVTAVVQPRDAVVQSQAAKQPDVPAISAGNTAETTWVKEGGPTTASTFPREAAAPALTWMDLLALLWLVGAATALTIQLIRHLLFLRTVRRWQRPITSRETLLILEREKHRLHIRQRIRLLLCPSVSSPMMIGLFRAKLLLPDEELTGDELALVFRHELTHLKRRDLWVKAALMLAMPLHWFNPAAYLMARSLGFWQESSCDESVTAAETLDEKRFYSETIIRVIRRQAQTRSLVTTSFYGSRNGMKRRILGILESGSKRVGVLVSLATLVLVTTLGMAFAIDVAPMPAQAATGRELAYVTSPDTDGAPMLAQPTVNDLNVPMAAYFAGTPVTIVERRASSAPKAWGYEEGEVNWARVLVGGDGASTGVSGWIPLRYLSTAESELPVATLRTDSPTGHVNLYVVNDADSALLGIGKAGEQVTLLGRVQKWYQIQQDGVYCFVAKENLALDDETQARFDTFRPDRYDTLSRGEYEDMLVAQALYTQKAAEYGGKSADDWSLEDKAWYGQMQSYFENGNSHSFQLPQEGDLPQEEAIAIAWNAFVTRCNLPKAMQEDYDFNLGFYSNQALGGEQKEWSVGIAQKGSEMAYKVTISSPSGAIVETTDADSYLTHAEGETARTESDKALAEWEAERGMPYAYWPAADKAAFSAQYGDGLTVIPDENAISQEQAEKLAQNELLTKYDIPAADVQGWKLGAEYRKEGGAPSYWRISFFDAQDNFLACVMLDAQTGTVLSSDDPTALSNG